MLDIFENEELTVAMVLGHSFAVCLEMNYDPSQMRDLWAEEIEGLDRLTTLLAKLGVPPLPAVANVLRLFHDVSAT